ncbi:MAG: hypothetical protein IJ493_07505 [Clostridia bacterium]|nr:hypothetical protein [Clostridia bacterium]
MSKKIRNPLIPMGAVTGDLTRQQIQTMLRRYADKGIQQFLMYPRDGCDVPYMSERWLEICGDIIETAASLDMDIWLYDEFNWPSGTCYGKVMEENHDYASTCVKIEDGRCVIAKTVRAPGSIPESYADILNPDAVDCFIRLTHEVYYQRFAPYFGTTIKGIFTDEPSINYFTYGGGKYPYFKDADRLYAAETGRDLFADMLEGSERFLCDYYDLLTRRFREVFVDRIAGWCSAHKILLTGHLLAEQDMCASVRANGDAIHVLRGFTLPAMDEISTCTSIDKAEWLTYGTLQAAIRKHSSGGHETSCGLCENAKGGLVETFALGPTDLPPARVEQMLWQEAMFNIDHYVLAVSAADARGNVKKNGWFNPMNYMNPWFEGYAELGETAIEAASLAHKTIAADVYVRYPATLTRKYLFDSEKQSLTARRMYVLLQALTRAQYQWLLLDEDEESPAGIPVLEITDGEDFSAQTLVASLPPRKLSITETDGSRPNNLFLRQFTDGSAVILDLENSDTPRRLIIRDGDSSTEILLPGRGHYVLGSAVPTAHETLCELSPTFRLTLDSPNTLRCNIRKDAASYTFRAAERLDGVRMLSRTYIPGGELSLDGIALAFNQPADALTPGLTELYASTSPFTLLPGEHTVTITKPAPSESFLPSCFICGSFADRIEDGVDTLYTLPETVGVGRLNDGILPQYAGKITLETSLELPDVPSALELASSELYTRVYINGVSLGGQLGGFRWEIPARWLGAAVTLRIEQFTSIGPIFGRSGDVIAKSDGERWASLHDWFPGKYQKCGVESMKLTISNG